MNFSESVKNEIISKPIKELHCKKAFLAGFFRGSVLLLEQDGVFGFQFRASETVVNYVLDNLCSIYKFSKEQILSQSVYTGKKVTVTIFSTDAISTLEDLGILVLDEYDYSVNFDMYGGDVAKKDCCLRAFFRGLFLSCGNCSVPMQGGNANTRYHLQLTFSHSVPAEATSRKLFKVGIECRIIRRRENYVVYLKSAESIKDFIAFLPAPVSVLHFTDLMISREISNKSNRQKNCDLGNLNKQVEASIKQIDAIRKIVNNQSFKTLKPELQQTAKMRVENPEDTLNELAQKLNVSKSCLNHRLRKIIGIADRL